MGDSLREKFLGGSPSPYEGDDGESGKRGLTDFDELKDSLLRITETWRERRRTSQKPHLSVKERDDSRAQWRKDLGEVLESTPVHVFVVVLLLVDLLATAVDILKTIHIKTQDLSSCTNLLEVCQCVDHFERTESWEVVYWISIAILSVLATNVILLLVACGWNFFRHPGYVLDAFVVGTALMLEIFLDSETVGLLVILTLWRIVRVAHGIFEVTDEAWENEIKSFEERLQNAESAHENDQRLLREKDARIAELEGGPRRRHEQQQMADYGSEGEQYQENYQE